VERDSGYALAYVGLAQSYVELGLFFDAPHETMPRAREFANRALQVAPDLTDARVLLGLISLVYDWDWEAAARAMTTDDGWVPGAIELFTCAAHLLESTGHGPEADVELRKALLVDPLSAALNAELGCGSYYRRRYDAAIQENLDALEFDPDNLLAFWGLGRAYGQKKMYREALDELAKVEATLGEAPPLIVAEIGYVQAASGRTADARASLRQLDALATHMFVDPYLVAAVHAGLGDRTKTLEWLEKAYEAKSGFLVALANEPKWDGVRSDPSFQRLMKRVGF
jgi:tetratricopeptide (TPR) repeat protein